jgi:protein TonB
MRVATIHRPRYRGTEPAGRTIGWGIVIAIHLLVLWALAAGTARRSLESTGKLLETLVIQEVIVPPPALTPPPRKLEKPERPKKPELHPRTVAAPPAYVPPAEMQPDVSSTAIAVQSVQTDPVGPSLIGQPPLPAPAPPASGSRAPIGVACPTQVRPEMPRKALQEGIEGVVKAQVVIRNGAVQDVTILSGPRVFHAAVRDAMLQYKCESNSNEVVATQDFVFKID